MDNRTLQQQMEDKPLTNAELLQRVTSRRSRKDQEGRDFQCGCGKRYLSYPALYTHIKTKHDSVQPQGTQKTGMNVVAKKTKKFEEDSKTIDLNYVERQDLKILKWLDQSFIGQVPLSVRARKEGPSRQGFDVYISVMRQTEIRLSKTVTLDLALIVYLINVGEFVSQKCYEYYLLFARLARTCYFEHGEEVYRNCFSKKQGSVAYLQTFNHKNAQHFPIICDFFIRYFIPYSQLAKQAKGINIIFFQLMVYDLCRWLFKKKMTNISIELKKQHNFEERPLLFVKEKGSPCKNEGEKEEGEKDKEDESEEEEESDSVDN